MQARMKNPGFTVPGALKALQDLMKAYNNHSSLSKGIIELVQLRSSQINGCSACVEAHCKSLKKMGESDERIFSVAAWRETPYYTEAERVALTLAEASSRLADVSDPVPDALWESLTRHFTEDEIATLTLALATSNAFNRINVITRQLAGGKW